ncbi:hypothetical protein ACSZMD_09325 [Aeromonas veronii]
MSKVAVFFGAGAEIGYGLPSGGKFALDIFKMDVAPDKKKFRDSRDSIKKRLNYAKNWLPQDFDKKPISSFGRSQYESLVKSSLEYKRQDIIKYLDNFDKKVNSIAFKFDSTFEINIREAFNRVLGTPFGTESFSHEIKVSTILGDYNKLFSSNFFSSYLRILEQEGTEKNFLLKKRCRDFCRAILELLVGALGEELVHNLNDGIFEKKPDAIDIFDDLGAIFSLDYRGAGLTGLEVILDGEPIAITADSSDEHLICAFALEILEDIFAASLDYQSLIDSNWRYLYSPKTDWAKFYKINIFLNTTRRYISAIAEKYHDKIITGNGYYHDIKDLSKTHAITAIGTTNYNDFISEITNRNDIYYLNGSVNDFYDPYLNKIIHKDDVNNYPHFTVPFLFTQSGIKPLTSIKMSERYVELYNHLKSADKIVIIGYGFNIDDGHINGLFRTCIEEDGKNAVIFHYTSNFNSETPQELKEIYKEKLRLNNSDNLTIIQINSSRMTQEGNIWHSYL